MDSPNRYIFIWLQILCLLQVKFYRLSKGVGICISYCEVGCLWLNWRVAFLRIHSLLWEMASLVNWLIHVCYLSCLKMCKCNYCEVAMSFCTILSYGTLFVCPYPFQTKDQILFSLRAPKWYLHSHRTSVFGPYVQLRFSIAILTLIFPSENGSRLYSGYADAQGE